MERIEVITVDHGLREQSAAEARFVQGLCDMLGLEHHIATVGWKGAPPSANIAAQARAKRYALIESWAERHQLDVIATAHHADDQAETLLMRLARGAGLSGLSAIRERRSLDGDWPRLLVRPLLGWRKAELEKIVSAAGITPVTDPYNSDPTQDRARLRMALAQAGFDSPEGFARAAANLAEAEEALVWMTSQLVERRLRHVENGVQIDATGLPAELQRRLLLAGFAAMNAPEPRGPKLVDAMAALERGQQVSLGPLLLQPADNHWLLVPAPPRKTV